ncbi:putative membrane-bound acid phosphatase [Leishmania infantum JPCM5]|uniref:Membrane-bound_acid_phosphatase_-_putative n=2 Tax=Leishmania infantum TaxID=5671 RepID=A0A6L0XI60_LEIIN|nr:putative membrane-bound acid phosphatase [Leishmania infantum JPCM5]CAC9505370.1 membrane-bound_acid_phosphatase_-_putative [Leishmania infantum]CAM69505.1 putative membrane-bound acid phosphatase [Leishmania infantum JPCM5]SUZ43448.1 membrane-bound_acid_phosphatase_-_putative [Leishmania infantum]|eukprot:XP_001470310.1 putative membrane-bound acid phosphatase [Leishmania infantum JPCM5]
MPAVVRSLLPHSMRQMCVLVTVTALLAVAHLPTPSRGSVEWVLQQVQVLHRHGSRSAVPTHNTTAICGSTPCGFLNPEGEMMMRNVGSFLRTRYNTDATVVDEPFLPSSDYDLTLVESHSTDVQRTLQSAHMFLAGMFPNESRLIPAIHTVPISQDTILYTFSQPWVALYITYAGAAQSARMNPTIDRYFPDWTELRDLGAAVWSEGYCSNFTTRLGCVLMVYDIATAKLAVGELPAAVAARYDDLHEIIAESYRGLWYYDPSNSFSVQQGGRGQPFLKQVVRNIDDFVAGRNTYKVMHYSGHDISLGAVWGTLGDKGVHAMQPPYAQTLVLELVKSASSGEHGVRVLRGWPGQTPETGFTFSWDTTWQLQCQRSNGTNYAATDNLCPLEDFRRYVAWTVGTDPRGMCLLDEETSALLDCPTAEEEQTVSVALPESCLLYRSACPAYACAPGYVLSAPGSQCKCTSASCLDLGSHGSNNLVNLTVKMSGVSGGAVAGISIATFCVGALFAVAVSLIVLALMSRSGGSAHRFGLRDKSVVHDEPLRPEL